MKHARTRLHLFSCSLAALATLGSFACADDGETGDSSLTAEGTTGFEGLQPFRESWQRVADAPFDIAAIQTLRLGGVQEQDNYAARGDIEVYYSLDAPRIVVEMRKFTFTDGVDAAQDDYARLVPWMFTGALGQPDDLDASAPDSRCNRVVDGLAQPWLDDCAVRIYFEGQIQKLRVGADIRVFLPKAWEGHLQIATEDNVLEPGYPNRGDVTVLGLPGSAHIELDSGHALVRLASHTEAVPACSEAQNAACDAVGWDGADPSCASCTDFGSVRVTTRGEQPMSPTVDVPPALWVQATLDNTQPGMSPASDPLCEAQIDCDGLGGCEWLEDDPQKPWRRRVVMNEPSAALAGRGYNVNLASGACATIQRVEGPQDFQAPNSVLEGEVELCSGCLEALPLKLPQD